MQRDQQANRVDAVANATKRERKTHPQAVDKGTGEETDHGERTVERGILRERLRWKLRLGSPEVTRTI